MWLVIHLSSHQSRHPKTIRRNAYFDMSKTTQPQGWNSGIVEYWNNGSNPEEWNDKRTKKKLE
jgi:hypothetical protein